MNPRRKKYLLWLIGLLLMALVLGGCGASDGEGYFHILYQNSQGEERKILISDSYNWNEIHVDEANHQLYCSDGSIIKMPTVAHFGGGNSNVTKGAELMAETVCDMGQETFDQFWQNFNVSSGEE